MRAQRAGYLFHYQEPTPARKPAGAVPALLRQVGMVLMVYAVLLGLITLMDHLPAFDWRLNFKRH